MASIAQTIRSCALAAVLALPTAYALHPVAAQAQDGAYWPEDAMLYIISPEDGATVASPVTVRFGLKGMGVAPAGVDKARTGHHHLLIDTDAPAGEDLAMPLPADENHVHFGGGQTETVIDLSPGTHTLQLIMGDMNHVPHDPPLVSKKITITVE